MAIDINQIKSKAVDACLTMSGRHDTRKRITVLCDLVYTECGETPLMADIIKLAQTVNEATSGMIPVGSNTTISHAYNAWKSTKLIVDREMDEIPATFRSAARSAILGIWQDASRLTNASLHAAKETHEQKEEVLRSEIAGLESNVTELTQALGAKDAKLSEMIGVQASLQARLNAADAQIESLSADNDALKTEMQLLASNIREIKEKHLAEVNAAQKAYDAEISRLRAWASDEVAKANERADAVSKRLLQQIDDSRQEVIRAKKDAEMTATILDSTRQALSSERMKAGMFEMKLQSKEEESELLKKQLSALTDISNGRAAMAKSRSKLKVRGNKRLR